MAMCSNCLFTFGCDVKEISDGCENYKNMKESNSMQNMLEAQAKLQKFLGFEFEEMSIEERVAFIKEHSIHLNQEINEALYELPFFKPWKNYDGMTIDEMAAQIKKYKEELVDAFHFFMNMMLAVDFTADEFEALYMEKNCENILRQARGYTHDVSYRDGQ